MTVYRLESRKKNSEGMFQCGHCHGSFLQLWPGDLFTIGDALDEAFRKQPARFSVFRKISDWRNYDDEYLSLSQEEAAGWQLEIEQVQRYIAQEEYMGWHEQEVWRRYFEKRELLYGDIQQTLMDGLRLCHASNITGNPIEFFW
jgi:hypothetical protein